MKNIIKSEEPASLSSENSYAAFSKFVSGLFPVLIRHIARYAPHKNK